MSEQNLNSSQEIFESLAQDEPKVEKDATQSVTIEAEEPDGSETVEVGPGTVAISQKDGLPYVGGSSPQGFLTTEDTSALPVLFSELTDMLKKQVWEGRLSRDEAREQVEAFAKKHNLPAENIQLNF